MATFNRIVLCDARGDELFSGSSLLSDTPPPASAPTDVEPEEPTARHPATLDTAVDDDEPVPPTLRSNVLASEPPSRPIIVEEADLSAA